MDAIDLITGILLVINILPFIYIIRAVLKDQSECREFIEEIYKNNKVRYQKQEKTIWIRITKQKLEKAKLKWEWENKRYRM